tara:strand:+ start:1911 stop:2483 length:573 start_codon:yes stop_codon:yes gene_type:complete
MTFTEIKREIAKRLGDNDSKKYRGVIGNSFLQAICEELVSGECDPVEYPELYVEESLNVGEVVGRQFYNYPSKMLKLIDVRSRADIFTKEITKEEYERMQVEEAFRPALNEIFWYQDNKYIWIIAEFNKGLIPQFIFTVYLKNPDSSQWNFDVDLIEDLKYGRNFIYKCIDKAVANIAAMPMLRPVTQGK